MTSVAAVAQGALGTGRVLAAAPARADEPRANARRRAQGVGVGLRLANALFGSPSVSRANGRAEASLTPHALRRGAWRARCAQTPVFEVDRRGAQAAERLPRVWVTEPVFDEGAGGLVGRAYVGSYPCDPDKGGWKALELAERYFGEALGYEGDAGVRERTWRVDCFRAAEILLLHAAHRGNDEACLRLAMIYQRDLCEGRYWKDLLEHRARHVREVPLEERAAAFLVQAASRGNAEALWRLGDVLADMGGLRNLTRAYQLFRRSYDAACRAQAVDAACAGQAAFRLGRCHERGWGCGFGFKKAQSWYRIAAEHLEDAYGAGEWTCKRALRDARVGVRRMEQEMRGC